MTPQLGTDGNRIVYPIRGIVQGIRETPQRGTFAYVFTLVAAAIVTTGALISAGYHIEAPLTVLALSVAAAVAERINVQFTITQRGLAKTEEQSIHLLPTLFAAVLFGAERLRSPRQWVAAAHRLTLALDRPRIGALCRMS